MARLFAGTSGFAYSSWKPDFYPAKLPAAQFLSHYAGRLNAVEINYTFRRLPSVATLEKWVAATPAQFVFCTKAHMRITHVDRLTPSLFLDTFFKAIDPLRAVGRLGPVLFQLPPALKRDAVLLRTFLAALPEDIRSVFEFRNASWLDDDVFAALRERGAGLCLGESDEFVVPEVVTTGFVYCRLRKSQYSQVERQEIAGRVTRLIADGKDVYAFFKHEETPAGALYAEELLRSLTAAPAAASN